MPRKNPLKSKVNWRFPDEPEIYFHAMIAGLKLKFYAYDSLWIPQSPISKAKKKNHCTQGLKGSLQFLISSQSNCKGQKKN